ncbi:MAG: reverse transcriptase domain-containing protein [Verrucomicrobiota bacterium]
MFCFVFLSYPRPKAIEHLVHPIFATPAATEATGVQNADIPPCPTSPARTPTTASPVSSLPPPLQQESDSPELSDDENGIVEVDYFMNDSKCEIDSECKGSPNVRGRLLMHIAFWQQIGAPDFILSTISEGYKIPFATTPASFQQRNNRSALEHSVFVTEAILEPFQGERISETTYEHLHNINPLSVSVQSSGKKRLIIDLRLINQHLRQFKFKYEDYKKALEYFAKGVYAINFDLKSGYHHLDICPHHRTFLGFCWTFPDGVTRYFMFNVLPFGLSTAPYIFTKLLRPLVKVWRSKGIQCVVYLDDGIALESSCKEAEAASCMMKGDLEAAGFVINHEKSSWTPVQEITWLGIVWNGSAGTIAVRICYLASRSRHANSPRL